MSRKQENSAPVKIGDRVWVERLKDHGLIVSLSDDGRRAGVELGKVRFNLEVTSLGPGREKKKASGRRDPDAGFVRPPRNPRVAREIDMHGLRVEEMLGRAEEVRVIHGHGSGALKKALHLRLREMGIRQFRLGEPGQTPGGDGVTIISL